jgi:hypothetical protein
MGDWPWSGCTHQVTDHSQRSQLQGVVMRAVDPSRSMRDASLPGPQPATLNRAKLSVVRQKRYQLLEKSDGERSTLASFHFALPMLVYVCVCLFMFSLHPRGC